jgi:hypothetical protein
MTTRRKRSSHASLISGGIVGQARSQGQAPSRLIFSPERRSDSTYSPGNPRSARRRGESMSVIASPRNNRNHTGGDHRHDVIRQRRPGTRLRTVPGIGSPPPSRYSTGVRNGPPGACARPRTLTKPMTTAIGVQPTLEPHPGASLAEPRGQGSVHSMRASKGGTAAAELGPTVSQNISVDLKASSHIVSCSASLRAKA